MHVCTKRLQLSTTSIGVPYNWRRQQQQQCLLCWRFSDPNHIARNQKERGLQIGKCKMLNSSNNWQQRSLRCEVYRKDSSSSINFLEDKEESKVVIYYEGRHQPATHILLIPLTMFDVHHVSLCSRVWTPPNKQMQVFRGEQSPVWSGYWFDIAAVNGVKE